MPEKETIQKDQRQFFNEHSDVDVDLNYLTPLMDSYANKEQYEGFEWIEDCRNILDYGCGTATSIDRFLFKRDPSKYHFTGVDIAEKAIEKAQEKYPNYDFYAIKDNNLNEIENESMDGAYIIHVLHHSHDHEEYFNAIYKKLKPGGKLLINDLSSRNPFIKLGRNIFGMMPKFVKEKFSNDLVVNDTIPDKYEVDVKETIERLQKSGFKIVRSGSGHLFFFLFLWLDGFGKPSRFNFIASIYRGLIKFENFLLKYDFFANGAELFYIFAVKPGENGANVPISGNYSTSFNKYVYDLIPEKSTVLDVGCWNGNLGAKLISDKDCEVDGIDVAEEMLNEAKEKGYGHTFNINLNNSDYNLDSIHKKYDAIVFADLLEHLIDPQKALEKFREKLNGDGKIIISLPNVAFGLNRLNLLLGKWNYTEFGTLDKTHLKFFTIKTVKELVKNSGYKVKKVQPYNQFGVLEKMKFLLDLWPEFFAYQIIVIASKSERK